MDIIKKLFKDNYKSLIFVYSLFIIESILFLLYPMILGNTIDRIIQKEYYYVIYLIGVLGGFITIAYLRRIFDTKVFTTLYRKVVLEYIGNEIDNKTDTSTINARSGMLMTIVDFIEFDFPYIFHTTFAIIGSVIVIVLNYNPYVGMFVGVFIIPIVISTRHFSKRLSVKYTESNNLQEKDVNVLDTKNKTDIKHHFINKNLLQIRISNIDAKNNLTNEIINYSLIILSLIMFTIFESVTVGTIMALYQYIIKFTHGAFMIPNLTLRYVYLKDVLNRISQKTN
jgi:hypothetical protein